VPALTNRAHDFLREVLEAGFAAVAVYEAALPCAPNEEVAREWQSFLSETRRHVAVTEGLLQALGVAADEPTPGRLVVRDKGIALVDAIENAGRELRETAHVVAAECIVDAETKEQLSWQLVGALSNSLTGEPAQLLNAAYEAVRSEEDKQLFRARGWCRELWLQALGLEAVVPPPEARRDVKTAREAAEAEAVRRSDAEGRPAGP
jgi:hypothetical protein